MELNRTPDQVPEPVNDNNPDQNPLARFHTRPLEADIAEIVEAKDRAKQANDEDSRARGADVLDDHRSA